MMMMFGRGRRNRGIPPIIGLVMGSGFFLMLGLIKATSALGPLSIFVWAMAIGGVVYAMKGPFGDAVLRGIAQSDEEVDAGGMPTELLHELEDLRAQVGELQERVDFTERMLAREREAKPLGAGERP
jgi:hypothetical protein